MTELADRLVAVRVGAAEMLVPVDGDRLYEIYSKTHQWYEADLLAAIKERQQGGTFVDVGANHGNHTVFFAVECQADKVISIEPYPGEYKILKANIAHNDLAAIVEPVPALVHPSWTSATLSSSTELAMPETWCYSQQALLREGGDTECVTLDELLADVQVDVIKVDVEEMGPAVLGTGAAMLERCRPLVAIEAEPSEEEAVAALLRPLGYEVIGVFCATPTFLWEAR